MSEPSRESSQELARSFWQGGGVSRRTVAVGIALPLLVACFAVLLLAAPMPFTRFAPGPTVDVLGKQKDGSPVVVVDGAATYPATGQLRMVTVNTTRPDTRLSLFDVLVAWASKDQDLYPKSAIYPRHQTDQQSKEEGAVEMASSQDDAVAAALSELGYSHTTYAAVLTTVKGAPADGKLLPRDEIVSVAGMATPTVADVYAAIKPLKPGDPVAVVVRRGGVEQTVTLTTVADDQDPTRAVIGVYPGVAYRFPFDVRVAVPDDIGGPSAGLIFALSIYDTLTPGSLTGGKRIAGTGTVDDEGQVGPIAGVRQKIAGAQRDGASLFLVPADNCDEAVLADAKLKVVPVATVHDAIGVVQRYAADPHADLPTCKAG